ncbi:MAG: hypothetical protein A2832_00255 [Candidatus Zambryskibacteria bacterium RIFCSPHIGHO2_01_FULL_44_22b]|uniref:Uncharacterized protein n=2 Tax=Candidatus Zambryskiibacteriota TaxID=1817925 RepID=A0A1G2T139_9BACT|nr:MAG: hypothetical protein A2832_00255 [Candidatus Zambryskibacteria bacterium RIFCSPHIGHO2_01_FULL_44_22b]OHB05477.1 MAG: hypothetical protein A3B16_01115 [Candidatus Zambryskibacteria bacterium RIFCSPLOWO2_01_FULL_45_43]
MTFKNSKLVISILIPTAMALIAILAIGIYSIRANNNETSKLLTLSSDADEAKVRAQATRLLRVKAAEDLEAFERLILSEEGIVSLIEMIEEAGQALNLDTEVVSVNKVDKEDADNPKLVEVVVEGRGAWAEAYALLASLESLPQRLNLEESNLSKVDGAWDLRVVLSLNYFD